MTQIQFSMHRLFKCLRHFDSGTVITVDGGDAPRAMTVPYARSTVAQICDFGIIGSAAADPLAQLSRRSQ